MNTLFTFLLFMVYCSQAVCSQEDPTVRLPYKKPLQGCVDIEATIKLDYLSPATRAEPVVLQTSSSKKKSFVDTIRSLRKRKEEKTPKFSNLISIDSLTKEVEASDQYLSPADCTARIVGTDAYWQYTELNAQYLKYHEDNPNDDPHQPIVRSKPDETFQFKLMPRDITALFVALQMKQKEDAKRKY